MAACRPGIALNSHHRPVIDNHASPVLTGVRRPHEGVRRRERARIAAENAKTLEAIHNARSMLGSGATGQAGAPEGCCPAVQLPIHNSAEIVGRDGWGRELMSMLAVQSGPSSRGSSRPASTAAARRRPPLTLTVAAGIDPVLVHTYGLRLGDEPLPKRGRGRRAGSPGKHPAQQPPRAGIRPGSPARTTRAGPQVMLHSSLVKESLAAP